MNEDWHGYTFKAYRAGQRVQCLNLTTPQNVGAWVTISEANLPRIQQLLDTGYTLRPVTPAKDHE